ncbi:MAG: aspartate aminotransferase family protein [Candidatus Eremiobacteraeota bacterium]|nr:aspartate aminotransferase family protein [Candidatus Eremiobacteraeota bacterium]
MGTIPGVRTSELVPNLQRFESRGITYLADDFPVFWQSAAGASVTDVDGNRYIDLTAAFGVANAGHSNASVASAIGDQACRLMHAMGDVHPTEIKSRLLQKLADIAPDGLSKTYLASTGAEAVEAALKTAMLATGKPAFAAFNGGYHGLSFGALAVCGIEKFRTPFARALPPETTFFEFPARSFTAAALDELLENIRRTLKARSDVGGLIVEPVQARAGIIVPPDGFLRGLREICNELAIVFILDEIYTGFGRTGTMFAAQHDGVLPDIICLGKALGNGFPISATIAKPAIMDAWERSRGEALHTSTYLGNPMGCSAALASIGVIEGSALPERARALGSEVGARLQKLSASRVIDVRGRGLMWGIQVSDARTAAHVISKALQAGVIVLQTGEAGDVVSVTPPLMIPHDELMRALDVVGSVLASVAAA